MILTSIAMTWLVLAVVAKILVGFPLIGGAFPFIGRRRLALNRDGSFVDTGAHLIEDEVGFYYIEPVTFEWLGFGLPLSKAYVRLTSTGEIVEPDFQVAGEAK